MDNATCMVEVSFTLGQATKVKTGSRGMTTFTLSSTLGEGVVNALPGRFTSKRPGAHCKGGRIDPRGCLDEWGKSRPLRYLIPEPFSL